VTDLLRLAIEGGLELGPSKRRMIFDMKASGRDRADPRTLRVKANRKLHRREAETIGRILTNERMRKSFMQVFASAQRAEHHGWPRYPTTLFPFDHPTRWTVDTVWTSVNDGSRRCLVTRIRSIKTVPLAFDSIVVELAGGAGELEPGEKARPIKIQSPETLQGQIRMHPHRVPTPIIRPSIDLVNAAERGASQGIGDAPHDPKRDNLRNRCRTPGNERRLRAGPDTHAHSR